MSRLTDQSLNRFIRLTGFVSSPSPSPRIHHLTASSSPSPSPSSWGWNPSLSSWDGNPTTSSCDCDWGRSIRGAEIRVRVRWTGVRVWVLGVWGMGASKPSKKSSYFCTMLDDFEGGPDSNNIKMGLPWTNSVDTGARVCGVRAPFPSSKISSRVRVRVRVHISVKTVKR